MWNVLDVGDDIEQGMNPVTEINVGNTAWLEHDFGSPRPPIGKGMRSAVDRTGVSLRLDDDSASAYAV